MFRRLDIWDLLPQISLPTVVSILLPPIPGGVSEHAKQVASLIPGARLVVPDASLPAGDKGRWIGETLESGDSRKEQTLAPQIDASVLSSRELEILRLLASGNSNPQIAEALTLSPTTVATHVRHILKKTSSANRTAAALWAREHGIV